MGDDDIIRGMNEDVRRKREEDRLKTLLGGALKSKSQKAAQRIDISGIVGLLTTKAEFDGHRKTVVNALSKIENLLGGLKAKVDSATETADVLGRLLATLARKGIVSQEDIIATSRQIEKGQKRVKEIHEEHKDKALDERLEIMMNEGVDELAVEEYEHRERQRAANRIVALHRELRTAKVGEDGKTIERGKTFKEVVAVIRAEGHPEEQVREFLVAFFPWADGVKGPGKTDDWFCPECDKGFADQDCEGDGKAVLCPECRREVFDCSLFVRPPEFGGEKDGEEVEGSETSEGEEEAEKVEFVEDRGLACPEDVESGDGFYDPASTGPEDDGFPLCAGCGTKKSEHKRALKLVTQQDVEEVEGEEEE